MKRQLLAIGVLSIAILSGCVKDIRTNEGSGDQSVANQANPIGEAAATDRSMPNEILIKFSSGTSETGRANALARINGSVQEHVVTAAMKHFGDNEGFYVVHTPLAVLDAVRRAKGVEVVYAEPNWVYTHDATSNDTYYTNGSLWGM
ncbi:MAG: peptidase S8, partial [Chitinophagaceae bacterium]|nr:peptidase S8 [Chitinophagaceae bacterium]